MQPVVIGQDADRFRAAIDAATDAVEPALAHALADELTALTGDLNGLAWDLGIDDDILRRHMESLQAIDRIVQTQLAIADLLRAGGLGPDRLATIGVEAVGVSLRTRYAEHRADRAAQGSPGAG